MLLLATGVNGNQPDQTFVVTYVDGSTTTITQSLSDWFTPQSYPGEAVAVATAAGVACASSPRKAASVA